ncbi:MAG: hypothetical protein ABSH14_05690 [Verrucomicrobiia bacterium]|jgi:hypothetical protein
MRIEIGLVVKRLVVIMALAGILISPALATFHEMQIEQVIGGVDGDTTAQAIQLRMRVAGQNLVSAAKLVAFDATGSNAITILDLATDVTNASAGSRILIVSSNFINSTMPTALPDFVLTTPIPSNYLAAGRLSWEDDAGAIFWSLSWGGTNYTGSNIANSTINDADTNFGPPFDGVLPSMSTSALLFTNSASAKSRSNVVDYVVTTGAATFTNNAGAGFTVVSQPPRITAISRELGDIRIAWMTIAGRTNVVQFTAGDAGGSFTNNFADLTGPIIVSGSGQIGTNYLDTGGATNFPSRFYRIRFVQ